MKNAMFLLAIGLAVSVWMPVDAAEDPIVFPKAGQTKEQQMKDKELCSSWAKEETGVDPSSVKAKLEMVTEQTANQTAARGGVIGQGKIIRGAAIGAAMGGLDDAIDSKAGAGAAKGGLLAASKARQEQKQAQQQQVMQAEQAKRAKLEEQYQTYLRAFSACMESKEYSVR